MNSISIELYVTLPTWPNGHIPQKFEFSKWFFIDFWLMKNIIFNKTGNFVGRNTSNHACQIFSSKGNCETMDHWFFLLEITVVKIMNNLNVCSAHSYLQNPPSVSTIKHSGRTESFVGLHTDKCPTYVRPNCPTNVRPNPPR
jgi:hypothetical protein